MLHRLPAHAPAHGRAAGAVHQHCGDADRRGGDQDARIGRVEQTQRDDVLAQQLTRACDDRVEHVLQRLAGRDGALDPRQPLKQGLLLVQRGEHAQRGEGQPEHLRHRAQQSALLRRPGAAWSGQQQPAAGQVADRDDQGGAGARSGDQELVAGSQPRQHAGRRPAAPETGARAHLVADDERAHLGLHRLGCLLDDLAEHLLLVGQRGHGDEQLGELLGGPARAGRRSGHATASTTRVWLWKPVGPLVRAISP